MRIASKILKFLHLNSENFSYAVDRQRCEWYNKITPTQSECQHFKNSECDKAAAKTNLPATYYLLLRDLRDENIYSCMFRAYYAVITHFSLRVLLQFLCYDNSRASFMDDWLNEAATEFPVEYRNMNEHIIIKKQNANMDQHLAEFRLPITEYIGFLRMPG